MQWQYCLMTPWSLPNLQVATEKVKRKKNPKSEVERYARRNQQAAPFSGKGIEAQSVSSGWEYIAWGYYTHLLLGVNNQRLSA